MAGDRSDSSSNLDAEREKERDRDDRLEKGSKQAKSSSSSKGAALILLSSAKYSFFPFEQPKISPMYLANFSRLDHAPLAHPALSRMLLKSLEVRRILALGS